MSCYHPLAGWPVGESQNGLVTYHPLGRYYPELKRVDPRVIQIPCGRCVGCRLDRSREWADRMMLELDAAGSAVFITLTYNNDHVPMMLDSDTGEAFCLTLDKRDWQLFMKRLRKTFPDRKLSFYAAGEYGENTLRPHMHAIIFGLSLEDFPDRRLKGRNELHQPYFISERLESIWQNGFTMLCDVSWKTCAYVSRYVQKKVMAEETNFVEMFDAQPEFALMSRRPGIGARYLDNHPEALDLSLLACKGMPDGVRLPKYYLEKMKNSLDESMRERYDKLKAERAKFSEDRMLLKLQQTGLSYLEQLEKDENVKLMRTKSLKRNKVI